MKTLLYVMPLFFAGLSPLGCSSDDSALGDSYTLKGTIAPWTQGAGFNVGASTMNAPVMSAPLTTGNVDASGNFSIDLPNGDALAPLLKSFSSVIVSTGCISQTTSDPGELQATVLNLTVEKSGSASQTLQSANFKAGGPPTAGSLAWLFIYADRDGHIGGQTQCNDTLTALVSNYDLDLKKGWNSVTTHFDEYTVSPTGIDAVTETYAGALPASINWQIVP